MSIIGLIRFLGLLFMLFWMWVGLKLIRSWLIESEIWPVSDKADDLMAWVIAAIIEISLVVLGLAFLGVFFMCVFPAAAE